MDTDTHTEVRGHVKMEAETEGRQLQDKEGRGGQPPPEARTRKKILPESLQRGHGSASSLISDSSLQNWERIDSCKATQSVTAALGN